MVYKFIKNSAIFYLICLVIVGVVGNYKINQLKKQVDGYKRIVNEMQNADDYDTCAAYPKWQPNVFMVSGTMICEDNNLWLSVKDGFTVRGPNPFTTYYMQGVTSFPDGTVVWNKTNERKP
jgi:hypothetical protein